MTDPHLREAAPRGRHWIPAAAVIALALAASISSLGNGFAYDDVHIVLENPRVHTLARWWGHFAQPYWPPPWAGGQYRPLTSLAFAAQWVVGRGGPLTFHLTNVALYAAVCVAVYRLAALVFPRARVAAWAAAALFAVHPVHVEAVANVVGQAELVVALALTWAVVLYLRRRAAGPLGWRPVTAIGALYLVACLSKEHGVILPALLLAAEWLLVRDAAPQRQRVRSLLPLGATLGAITVAFLAARAGATGDTGDMIHPALLHRTVSDRLLIALGTVPEWARLLLWPARLSADYSPQQMSVATGLGVESLLAAALLLGLVLVAVLGRRCRALAFGLVWAALAILPVSNVLLPTGILLAERTLFLPSVGAMLALAAVATLVGERRSVGVPARRAACGALALLLAVGVWRSAGRQPVWRDSETLFRQTLQDAPLSYRAHWARGGMLFQRGQRVEGERELLTALALFPGDPAVHLELGREYRKAGMCGPALPSFEQALAIDPAYGAARVELVLCLVQMGRFSDARTQARVGLASDHPAIFRQLLTTTDSILAARDSSGKR